MTNLFIIFLLFVILINLIICSNSRNLARFLKIVDYPSQGKKIHLKPTPLIGGLIFFTNIFLFILFEIFTKSNFALMDYFLFDLRFISHKQIATLVVAIFFTYLIGLYDDIYDLSPSKKSLLFLVIIYLLIISNPNMSISELRFYIFENKLNFNNFSIFFTMFCILAFMNSANMFDGINLQSAILYSSFLLVFFIKEIDQRFLLIFLVSMIFFFYMNMQGKIFLGNNGSYFLSFLISIIIISDHNWNKNYFVEEIILYMFLPGIDMIRLVLLRIIKNKNPLEGDNNHIHHLLVKKFKYLKSIIIIFLFIFIPIILFNYLNIDLLILILLSFIFYLMILMLCVKKTIN